MIPASKAIVAKYTSLQVVSDNVRVILDSATPMMEREAHVNLAQIIACVRLSAATPLEWNAMLQLIWIDAWNLNTTKI